MTYGCLYRNGGLSFDELTAAAGIAQVCGQFTGWGGLVFDSGNDGLPDLFVANGDAHHLYPQQCLLFRNRGDWTFEDVSLKSGDAFVRKERVGRGAASGDYDNDGDIDVLVNNLDGPPSLLRNETSAIRGAGGLRNRWLTVRLVGGKKGRGAEQRGNRAEEQQGSREAEGQGSRGAGGQGGKDLSSAPPHLRTSAALSNRDGIGARVRITTGTSTQTAESRAGSGYLSSSDPRIHFGLGRHARIDLLEVRWPGGTVQTLRHVRTNQILTIREPVR
jgi:hypothetical protein